MVLNAEDFDDGHVDTLNTLTNLTELRLDSTAISDDGIARLSLPKLKTLALTGCEKLTDKTLASLAGLPSLERLILSDSGVGGEQLAPLAEHPTLRYVEFAPETFRGAKKDIAALKEKTPRIEIALVGG